MSQEHICEFCNQAVTSFRRIDVERYSVECKTCGRYESSDFEDLTYRTLSEEEKAIISAYTRELFEYGLEPPKLHILDEQGGIEKIIERYRKKTIYEKLDRLIQYAEKNSSYFGENIHSKINSSRDYPITCSKNINEFENILSQARNAGLLRSQSRDHLVLTWSGWRRADEIKETGIQSKKCFVAMSCSEDMNAIYEQGIKEAVIEAGYDPIFIEKEEHNEKICDLIIAEIRGCKFLIADVTGQRQNVYYEAGFAHGLNRDVIWTCRHDEIERAHFDTRQYNHITWTNAEDLKKKLVNRIKATIL
jgi:nucleoside 2-deoxyribosyltransferase